MLQRTGAAKARRPREDRLVRHSVLALVLAAAFSFVAVGSASVYFAKRISRTEVLAEAARSAHAVGNSVFAPVLPAVLAGDDGAVDFLDRAVRIRSRDGALVRVKVWSADGEVIYSDDHELMGKVFPHTDEVDKAIGQRRSSVSVSKLDDDENFDETTQFDQLVEAYVPLRLDNGQLVVFETYSTDERLRDAESRLTSQLVPFAVAGLLVLLLTQLPVAVLLIRRVGRAQQERSRLLANSLAASDRERRNIARDLHDGVVQDLAGAGYALGAVGRTLPDATTDMTRDMLEMSSAAVERSVRDLRTLIVDIHPPDVKAEGLEPALQDLAAPLRATGRTEVDIDVALEGELSDDTVRLLYRGAREFLVNIAKHAEAGHVAVELSRDAEAVRLQVSDDGRGLGPDWAERRAEGHVGLALLADAAGDLGGSLTMTSVSGEGTTALLVLPTAPAPHA